MASFLIALFIIMVSHLTTGKDIPDGIKVGAGIVFFLIALLYVIFGIIL